MRFSELVDQASEFLRRRERVSYRALKREFDLDDDTLEDLKAELLDAQRVARDEEGKVFVWAGAAPVPSFELPVVSSTQPQTVVSSQSSVVSPHSPLPGPQHPSAERRQLTVMFCDLVGSTALSARLDPEDLREVVRQYQQTCAEVIQRHEGYIAQYLGDGLLVYFGYPTAHEDDARRAIRAGLEIVEAIRLQVTGNGGQAKRQPLQVRIGIHTGLVVIGDIGASGRTEQLALGETPNVAARIQGLAEPNTVLISAATQRLIEGQFECQPFGSHLVKGIDTPIAVYHVQSERQSGGYLEGRTTLTPLVGREQEVGLLFDRWEQVKEGRGQVILLSGEPGIGKSRLAYTLREQVTSEGSLLFEARCSPYHQHSAFYPLIEGLQRTLLLTRQDTDDEKVQKLERALALYNMQETLPLFTALLSLPTPSQSPPLSLTPQKQKERTLQALVQLLVAQAERQATVSVWEDLHWVDPSSLEFLSLLIEQIPTSKLLLVLTFRPEFLPLWKPRSHISQMMLNRLGKKQVEAMIAQGAAGKDLPSEIINQIRIKADGVPLFVEELTKSVVEARLQVTGNGGREGKLVGVLAIPATLQEALLARLDRLSTARQVAQLGATLGREFSYELLHAVAPTSETDLQVALAKLVEAEILYQRGIGEQAHYFFKHALIQDTAYQSLLKSTRQQYHQQIALTLEDHFPNTKEKQPELLAYHYTEAGLIQEAIPYWQQAGQRSGQRSANAEAISHLNRALKLLKTLPDTPDRAHQELTLQIAYGSASMAAKGYGVPEVEKAYARARELCQQLGEAPQIFPVLVGLNRIYSARAELHIARELGEQCVTLAQRTNDPSLLVEAHRALGTTLYFLGELTSARSHLEQVIALYKPHRDHSLALFYVIDPAVSGLSYNAWVLWLLGYPDQALKRSQEATTLAQELAHPFTLSVAQMFCPVLYQFRQEWQTAQERAEEGVTLATEREFTSGPLAWGMVLRGWALSEQGQREEGITQIRQGMAAWRATGAEIGRTHFLALLAEAYGKAAQVEEGLQLLTEALELVDKSGECFYEAELYRLKGTLTLQLEKQKAKSKKQKAKIETDPRPLTPDPQSEAEAYFHKAIEIARQQQAKSWELRVSTSLARLWQQQGKKTEAHKLLSDVYNWFTEGFDTKDLQEAKALLESLESGV
jgi:class 3 adenylate cyclase/predicted ATPase